MIGIGHGTVAPLGFSSSLLGVLVDLGPIIPILGTPVLWGLYFLLIPDIESRANRIATIFAVLILHLSIGFWLSVDDSGGMARAYEMQPGAMVIFFVLFVVSFGLLIVISMKQRDAT